MNLYTGRFGVKGEEVEARVPAHRLLIVVDAVGARVRNLPITAGNVFVVLAGCDRERAG